MDRLSFSTLAHSAPVMLECRARMMYTLIVLSPTSQVYDLMSVDDGRVPAFQLSPNRAAQAAEHSAPASTSSRGTREARLRAPSSARYVSLSVQVRTCRHELTTHVPLRSLALHRSHARFANPRRRSRLFRYG